MCLLVWATILLLSINQVPGIKYLSVDSEPEFCLNIIHPTNWQNAFEACQELGAETSIIQVLNESEVGEFYDTLQHYNIYAFWTGLRKNYSSNEPISSFLRWSESDGLVPDESCGLVTALPGDGGLKLRPSPCEDKHIGLCLAIPPQHYQREGIFCSNVTNDETKREPSLTLRSDGRELLLLFPESLSGTYFCEEEKILNELPGNPKCWLLGFRPWHPSSTVTLECYEKRVLEFGVTKIQIKVIARGEGYLICQAWTTKYVKPLLSNTVLKQSNNKNQRYALFLEKDCNDSVNICRNPEETIETLAGNLNKKFLSNPRYTPAAIVSQPFSQTIILVIHLIGVIPDQVDNVIKNNTGFDVTRHYSIQYCVEQQPLWQFTNANTRIIATDGTAYRMCHANFTFGAQWGPVIKRESSKQSSKTKALQELYKNAHTRVTDTQLISLYSVMINQKAEIEDKLTADDNIILSLILDSIDTRGLNSSAVEAVAQVTAATIKQEKRVLEVAQKTADSGNLILKNIDRILSEVDLHDTSDDKVLAVTSNFATLVFDVQSAGCKYHIRGLALLKTPDIQEIRKEDIVILTWDDKLDILTTLQVRAAALFPLQLLASFLGISSEDYTESELLSQLNQSCLLNKLSPAHKDRIVISIFWNDTLFVQNENNKKLSTIVGVTVNGLTYVDLNYPLLLKYDSEAEYSLFFNTDDNYWQERCVFWDLDSGGSWSQEGCLPLVNSLGSCACYHTTHFGEMLHGMDHQATKKTSHKKALNFISLIGCLLSLAGLVVIILTALIFPTWRHQGRAVIQLQLCVAICGLATVLSIRTTSEELLLNWHTQHGLPCILSGTILHVFLLASLMWMFVAGLHMRRRLNNPFSDFSEKPMITKFWVSALPCWVLPIGLAGASLWASKGEYEPPDCYPQGQALQFGVTVPAHMLIAANTLILSLCIHATCSSSNKSLRLSNASQIQQRIRRQLIFTVYLSVLLGSGWIFGLMHMDAVFNLTASLQGFSIFLFAIVFDEKTRYEWRRLLCGNLDKRQSGIKIRQTLTSSILTSSTAVSTRKSLSLKEDLNCTLRT